MSDQPAVLHAYTQLGNARRLLDRHGHQLRYVHGHRQWRVWDGQRWAPDTTGEVTRLAIDTVATSARNPRHPPATARTTPPTPSSAVRSSP